MTFSFKQRPNTLIYKIFTLFLSFSFLSTSVILPTNAHAQFIPTPAPMPAVGTIVPASIGYTPASVRGITIFPENPLQFSFMIDLGDSGLDAESAELKDEAQRMINYFMAGLTVPEDELWVNLSPYENNRVIADSLGQTAMGRDMLAQDYLLKQLTASLMYPEDELGDTFWNRVKERAMELYGTDEIPTNVLNKVWIAPDTAEIYIHNYDVILTGSRLKVMLEEDLYAARQAIGADVSHMEANGELVSSKEVADVIREVLIPEIEYEINHGENFATLRQIFNSVILASWYKDNLKETLLSKVYVDQNKLKGIDDNDAATNEAIYEQYVEAFEQGVYNYIKEEYDPATQSVAAKKYFSGGIGDFASLTRTDNGELGAPTSTPQQVAQALGGRDWVDALVNLAENPSEAAPVEYGKHTPTHASINIRERTVQTEIAFDAATLREMAPVVSEGTITDLTGLVSNTKQREDISLTQVAELKGQIITAILKDIETYYRRIFLDNISSASSLEFTHNGVEYSVVFRSRGEEPYIREYIRSNVVENIDFDMLLSLANEVKEFEQGYQQQARENLRELESFVGLEADETASASSAEQTTGQARNPNFRFEKILKRDGLIRKMALSRSGQWLATLSMNGTVEVRDVQSEEVLRRYDNQDGIMAMHFSADARQLIVGKKNGTLVALDLTGSADEETVLYTMRYDTPFIEMVRSSDGKWLLALDEQGKAALDDVEANQERYTTNPNVSVNAIAMSDDGNRMALGYKNGDIAFGSINDTSLSGRLNNVEIPKDITFSPDGKKLLVSYLNDSVTLWDLESKNEEFILKDQAPTSIAFSPDGTRILTANAELMNVWDVATGQNLESIELVRYDGPVMSAHFSPNGRQLFTGQADEVTIWTDANAPTDASSLEDFNRAVVPGLDGHIARLNASRNGTDEEKNAAQEQFVKDVLEETRDYLKKAADSEDALNVVPFNSEGTNYIFGFLEEGQVYVVEESLQHVSLSNVHPQFLQTIVNAAFNKVQVHNAKPGAPLEADAASLQELNEKVVGRGLKKQMIRSSHRLLNKVKNGDPTPQQALAIRRNMNETKVQIVKAMRAYVQKGIKKAYYEGVNNTALQGKFEQFTYYGASYAIVDRGEIGIVPEGTLQFLEIDELSISKLVQMADALARHVDRLLLEDEAQRRELMREAQEALDDSSPDAAGLVRALNDYPIDFPPSWIRTVREKLLESQDGSMQDVEDAQNAVKEMVLKKIRERIASDPIDQKVILHLEHANYAKVRIEEEDNGVTLYRWSGAGVQKNGEYFDEVEDLDLDIVSAIAKAFGEMMNSERENLIEHADGPLSYTLKDFESPYVSRDDLDRWAQALKESSEVQNTGAMARGYNQAGIALRKGLLEALQNHAPVAGQFDFTLPGEDFRTQVKTKKNNIEDGFTYSKFVEGESGEVEEQVLFELDDLKSEHFNVREIEFLLKALKGLEIHNDAVRAHVQANVNTIIGDAAGLDKKSLLANAETHVDEWAQKRSLSTFDRNYLFPMYQQALIDPVRLKIGENFKPNAALTSQEQAKYMNVVKYKEIKNDSKYFDAHNIRLVLQAMNGGMGASMGITDQHMYDMTGHTPSGKVAKSMGLFKRVTLTGYKENGESVQVSEPVSIIETKYLRALKEATQAGDVDIEELVSSDSKDALENFLDSIYIHDRIDQRSGAPKRTYRQVIEQELGIEMKDFIEQGILPVYDIETGKLSDQQKAPGGHGVFGSLAMQTSNPSEDALHVIKSIHNGDGWNNQLPLSVAKMMQEEGVGLVIMASDRQLVDSKGGILGVVQTSTGDWVEGMMEIADAKRVGQDADFQRYGLVDDAAHSRQGEQLFNTNVMGFNESLLDPFLKELQEYLGEEKFNEITSPSLIENEDEKGGFKFRKLEGAIGHVWLNFNKWVMNDTSDEAEYARELLKQHGINSLLTIIEVDAEDRAEVFTPNKFALDAVMFESDRYKINPETWMLENVGDPQLTGYGRMDLSKNKYYGKGSELHKVRKLFSNTSLKEAGQVLELNGKIALPNTVIKGNVRITFENQGDEHDINDYKELLTASGVQTDAQGRLIFDNKGITVYENGEIRVQNFRPDAAKLSDPQAVSVEQDRVGGIDLNPELLNLQIKRDASGVPLPLIQQPLQDMQIDGFLPVIINIAPVANMPLLLGLIDDDVFPINDEGGELPIESAQVYGREELSYLREQGLGNR